MERSINDGDWKKKLPKYSAPKEVWTNIENELQHSDQAGTLAEILSGLPEYKAPPKVWDAIDKELHTGRMEIIKPYFSRIAASLIFILALTWYFNSSSETIQYGYDVETFNPTLQLSQEEEDESGFALIEQLCAEKSFVCEKPQFTSLKSELDELTLAAHEIKDAIGNINSEPLLIAQLKDIELERTQIINQLIVIIQNV